MLEYNDFVEEIPIENYDQLIKILHGKTPNFREKYVFRGVGSVKHELIPSALRNDDNDNPIINDYLDSNFWVVWAKTAEEYYKEGKISKEQYNKSENYVLEFIGVDKKGNRCSHDSLNRTIHSENEFHFKKELNSLLKFLNLADRSGLKISTSPEIRKLIHENLNYRPENNENWPHEDFLEIISLAQHYTLPTEALDWSYDYNISLYFAVQNILDNNEEDCILWALNYKLFEESYTPHFKYPYKLQFYRPEYNTNPNLRAQKGLFTFITHKIDELDKRPLNEIIVEDFINNINEEEFKKYGFINLQGIGISFLPENEKIFYKFIIPGKLKHEILNELYLNGYSEEYIFPGYSGVVMAIENRVKLDNYIKNLNKPPKINMIMSFNNDDIDNIFTNNKRIVFKRNITYEYINQIFIYSKESHEILGYFKGNEIDEYPPENLWFNFKEKSAISEDEFFNYFENSEKGYAIRINDLIKFKYPIKIPDFKLNSEFYFIHPNDSKVNFLLNFEE